MVPISPNCVNSSLFLLRLLETKQAKTYRQLLQTVCRMLSQHLLLIEFGVSVRATQQVMYGPHIDQGQRQCSPYRFEKLRLAIVIVALTQIQIISNDIKICQLICQKRKRAIIHFWYCESFQIFAQICIFQKLIFVFHYSNITMGNQSSQVPPQSKSNFLLPPLPTQASLSPHPPTHQHKHGDHREHTTLQPIEQMNMEQAESLMKAPTQKIKIYQIKPLQINKKTIAAPPFLQPLKKNKSCKLMEEIMYDKQNVAMIDKANIKSDLLGVDSRVRNDANIEISDLRESENTSTGDIKDFRVKKIRVSRNSLCSPGAYYF